MKRDHKKNHSSLPPKDTKDFQRTIKDENENNLKDPFIYSADDDIYKQFSKEGNIDPENTSLLKQRSEHPGKRNEKDFDEDMSGDDLDVPGSELDDQQEEIGSEDEENNYYSLGGDNHTDLDED